MASGDSMVNKSDFASDTGSLEYIKSSSRNIFGAFMTGVAGFFTFLAIVPLLIILTYLLVQGISTFSIEIFTELPPPPLVEGGGFGNAIVGTIVMVGIGAIISVPSGVLAAIYLSEFSSPQISYWISFANNVLSGVPSIIIGVFAYAAIVLDPLGIFGHRGYSAFAGGFALSVLMLPIIVRTTYEALKLIPQEVRQASVGVGANDYQTVLQIILPSALPAVVTGVSLAVARAAGETAPLIFTALFTQYWPKWDSAPLQRPMASLAVLVYNFATSPFENQQRLAWAASFILVILVLITNIIARWAISRRQF